MAKQAEYWQWQLEKLQAMAEQVTSPIDDVGGGRGNKISDKVGNTATVIADSKISGAEKVILDYLRQVTAVKAEISKLKDPLQEMIMNMRYVDGMRWEEIASRSIYSLDWCYELHRKALKKLGIWEKKKNPVKPS